MIDDIRYLIVFARIVEHGSISGGAEALGLSSATASQHLARLEKRLGTALLLRNTRKLALTADGARMLETANAMLQMYESGVIDFKQRGCHIDSKLRVTIPSVLVDSDLMAWIARFIKAHPGLQVDLACNDAISDIVAESFDLAFRIGDLPDSALKARRIFDLPRTLVASNILMARFPPLLRPQDLENVPWIGLTMRPDVRVFRHLSGETVGVRYVPKVRVDSVDASWQLARHGVGLAAPPAQRVAGDIERGLLCAVLPEWSLDALPVHAVWSPNQPRDGLVRQLIDSVLPTPETGE